jgi:hypothetical protein
MKAGTYIKLPDGRIGTICWNNIDGQGGIWGFHPELKELADIGFDDRFPCPEFMLRLKIQNGYDLEKALQSNNPVKGIECIGEEFEIIEGENNEL